MRGLTLAARLLLGAVFVIAGVLKGMSPYQSVMTVGSYDLTSPNLSIAAGIVLPGLEVIAGVALLGGILVRGAALLSVGLSGVFTAGVLSVLHRRLDIDCGCFGHLAITPRAGWGTVAFDLTLVALGLVVLLGSRRR